MTAILNSILTPSSDGFTGVVTSTDDHVIKFHFSNIAQFTGLYRRCQRIFANNLVNEVVSGAAEDQYLLCPEDETYFSFRLRPISEYFSCHGYQMVVAGRISHYAAYHLVTGAAPLAGFYESTKKAKQAARRKMQTKKDKLVAALKNLITVNLLVSTDISASGPTI